MISPETLQRIRSRLDLNERLVWCGKPVPRAFNKTTLSMMLFGLPWTAITGLVSGGFFLAEDLPAFPLRLFLILFFIPFYVVAISMLGAPLWSLLRQRRWVYVVTDKSARIMGAFRCTTWRRQELDFLDRADHRNGLTDIHFSHASYMINGSHPLQGFINLPTAEASAAIAALKALRGE